MNIFSVLSMGKSRLHETSMSAMLAYLLNPNEDHGIGNKFLKRFFEISNEKGIYDFYINNIDSNNLRFDIELEVPYYRNSKRNDIDVQIKIFDKEWNELHRIIIENKIKDGAANSQQLERYHKAILCDENEEVILENKLSFVFLTHESSRQDLINEFTNLNTSNKIWLNWNNTDKEKNTIVKIIQQILELEVKAEISPINEYMRHTLKAFTFFINNTLQVSSNKTRNVIDSTEIIDSELIFIDRNEYKIVRRKSGQIQLFDEEGEQVKARPLLERFLKDKDIDVKKSHNTKSCGRMVINLLKDEKNDLQNI